MAPLTSGGENAVFIDGVDQFSSGGEDTCVADAVSMIYHSVAPGKVNPYTAADVQAMANRIYIKYNQSITSQNGLTEAQLHSIIGDMGLDYEPITLSPTDGAANDRAVRQALRDGKIMVICAWEHSFYDVLLGKIPYLWDSTPFNHCIIGTGNAVDGKNIYARDTAETGQDFPPSSKRVYNLTMMQYVSLTAVIPSWLKGATPVKPYSPASADFHVFFKVVDANHWHCPKYNTTIQFGILKTFCQLSMDGQSLPIVGLPTRPEMTILYKGAKLAVQIFERAGLCYDPGHVKDNQPGMNDVFLLKLSDPELLSAIATALLPPITP